MKFTQFALVSAATLAVAQPHNHMHRHPARHGSPIEGRDTATTTTVAGPVITVYELNGQKISWEDVQQGIKDGIYILVGDSVSSVVRTSSTSCSTTVPTTSSSAVQAAQFYESKSSTSTSTSTTPTSTYVPPTTSASPTPTPEPTTTTAASTTSSAANTYPTHGSGATGIDADFPSGDLDCSTFPSAYGAVAADWLNLNGWTGIQKTPSYSVADTAISYIETAVSGGCTANSFCSYACPAGYQKSQWPSAQGATGQSIGGLYCNSNGKLELSRTNVTKICTAGVGGVKIKNKLSKHVAICRTDYPGTESETVALSAGSGSTVDVTCPNSADYYTWQGSKTTAQYYINPSGYSVEEGCKWGSASSTPNWGNWAPVNLGVGQDTYGIKYLSLFQNAPTNPDGVLDFNIKITGDFSGSCAYTNGKFYKNGEESKSGCTIGSTGDVTFEFS